MLPMVGRSASLNHARDSPRRARKAWGPVDPSTNEGDAFSGKWFEQPRSSPSNDSLEHELWDVMESVENLDMCRRAFSAATDTPWSPRECPGSVSRSESVLLDKEVIHRRRVRLTPLNHVLAFQSRDDARCADVGRDHGFESPSGSSSIEVSPFKVPLPPPPRVGKTWSGRQYHRLHSSEEGGKTTGHEDDEHDIEAIEERPGK
mmetsp:Transcript_64051/g.134652  ORF Transcript_64051/g.134652 Transcript_64051/m.134652 type:complete len:204 (+) Transcript_64051:190-801(+)